MQSYKKEISKIGPVLFERSKKAKHLNITVKPDAVVRVAVPYTISFSRAENFVINKSTWIQKHLRRMKKHEQQYQLDLKKFAPIDKKEAQTFLLHRLYELAKLYHFNFSKVSIRNQRTRWGSCSAKNNISLNIKLIQLPDELIDYVLLHELVHTKIKNHKKEFWQELAKYVNDINKKRQALRNFGSYLDI